MLDVRHLRVSYGATEVLRDVSFGVEAGEIVALLGGNGSGKTTTLNVLSGLVRPEGGTVDAGRRAGRRAWPPTAWWRWAWCRCRRAARCGAA